ncbi:MAG: prepilin-type N-terminal cleavage/methylation domain-containing protein [Synergistaceae bacterium]|nr:prepilin-type N-terminal cleavage/methylation domain-containing protein [Synergistaceae bacterium]
MIKNRKGFTLVELLIVIVIIGILAAAMLLSSGSATDSAEASNIISDLRSLKSAALLLHADSMDDPAYSSLSGAPLLAAVAKYADNPDKFVPSTSGGTTTTPPWTVNGSPNDGYAIFRTDVAKDGVRTRLASRADNVGLIGGTAATDRGKYQGRTGDTHVGMIMR